MRVKFNEVTAAEAIPELHAHIDGHEHEMRKQVVVLRKFREHRRVTQRELSVVLGVAQSNVSRAEHVDYPRVSTVRRFIEALGGELVLQARIDGEIIDLLVLAH
jgi:predicted transcriptional regulator